MASSNRHWPSMFKSKPCNTTHNNWHHELNSGMISNGCHRPTYSPGPGCEERTPDPKPRWNPRPEQIRILESIFNSGMVNPPRDEIRKIRAQLQEYGQVGDANVFYWFQNRKSRSKHKQRQLQKSHSHSPQTTAVPPPPQIITNAASVATSFMTVPSSSSSDKSSSSHMNEKTLSTSHTPTTAALVDLLNSPTASVNQNQQFIPSSSEFLTEPFLFPVQQSTCYSDHHVSSAAAVTDHQGVAGNCSSSFLLSDLMLMSQCPSKKDVQEEEEKMQQQQQQQMCYSSEISNMVHPFLAIPAASNNEILTGGVESEVGPPTRSTVFINEVWFEVGSGPFNVREAFGDDAVLIQSTGQPVMTNEWGVTLQPLQHGGFYYLLRPFAPMTPVVDRTIDLI